MVDSNPSFDIPSPPPPQILPPLTAEDMRTDTGGKLAIVSDDTLQLQADVVNVMEGRVELETFDKDYQKKIENYYRFHPVLPGTRAAEGSTQANARSDKL